MREIGVGMDINEIVLCTMKSERGSDEIFGVPPQMKLNPPLYPDEVGFHRAKHDFIYIHAHPNFPQALAISTIL